MYCMVLYGMAQYGMYCYLLQSITPKHHLRGPGGEVGTSGGGVRSGAGREGRSHGGSGALPAEAGHGTEVPMASDGQDGSMGGLQLIFRGCEIDFIVGQELVNQGKNTLNCVIRTYPLATALAMGYTAHNPFSHWVIIDYTMLLQSTD